MTRSAGILAPLFSIRSARDWGIGDFSALGRFLGWVARAGHSRVQLLPLGEMPDGERSPYSAMTAFAFDPVYIAVTDVEDALGDDGSADGEAGAEWSRARSRADTFAGAPVIDYTSVRRRKLRALWRAFRRFEAREWPSRSDRSMGLRRFRDEHRTWLEPYLEYRAASHVRQQPNWMDWEAPLAFGAASARTAAAAATERWRWFFAYVQWIATEQWNEVRRQATRLRVALDGDLPFAVSRASVDVWNLPDQFDLIGSLGAPPDHFNPDGQDWQLPPYAWSRMAADGFGWLRARMGSMDERFDGCRLDHVVGFFRMWVRGGDGLGGFVPADPAEQLGHGSALMDLLQRAAPDLWLMAEDLGDVPSFVREALAARKIPGCRVVRWEWDGGLPIDPRTYPPCSVATWGTHDTSSLRTWWSTELDEQGRAAIAAAPGFSLGGATTSGFSVAVHRALLDALYGAASDHVLVPFPDTYGAGRRINLPGTVGDANWDYRIPWTVEELEGASGMHLARPLLDLAVRHQRVR